MSSDAELVIERIIAAPREKIWRAFSDPEYLRHWWGPNGFVNTTHERSFTVGGVWRYTMHGPDGTDYPNRIRYEELIEPERIVYLHDSDTDQDPDHFKTIIMLEEAGEKTKVTLRMVCTSAALKKHIEQHGALEGGKQHLARLEQYVTTGGTPP